MILPSTTRAAVSEFSTHVRACFGHRLAQLALFGSHARGEATEDSDVDILVVIDDLDSADTRQIDAIVGDILTRTDVILSPLVMRTARFDELRARERRLAADIEREGIPL
jgi:predicted nucleotidyltransferase